MKNQSSPSRRDILKGGALLIGFCFHPGLSQTASGQPVQVLTGKPVDGAEVDSFLVIHKDGTVTVFTGKVDLGTGLRIAVRQMAAEELGLTTDKVHLVEGDTALTPDQGRTGGSSGLTQGGVGVRQAAATARLKLLQLASDKLDRPLSDLVLFEGTIRPSKGGKGVTLAELVGDKPMELKVNPKATLKDPATYTVVGKALPRPDVPGKCTGQHTYVSDFKLPGMLHGRVIRPPSMGAKLLSVDESSLAGIPDVRVVRINDFLGVVSKNEWAAVRAVSALKAKWTDWQGLPEFSNLQDFVRNGAIEREENPVKKGDVAKAKAAAVKQLAGTYFFPYQGHASMAPSCAVADYRDTGLTVWTGSQSTHLFRTIFAQSFGLPEAKVRLIYLDGSGCYGQNAHEDAAADAAILSRAVGSPVRVQWMRQDEHGWDPKGPPQLVDLRASVGADGNLVAWETETWIPVPINTKGTIPLVGLDSAGISQRQGRWPGTLDENLDPPYKVENVNVAVHRLKESPLRPGHVRSPGKIANAFAVESLTDELAVSAGVDSVAYRLHGLEDPRAVAVLKKAADLIGWKERVSPNPNATSGKFLTGRGVAYVRYRGTENYVATAIEVAVDPASGKVSVQRVCCAHDCGLVVNPDALKNQIEGSIVQTISKMLHEEVKFNRSRVTAVDWMSYPVIRFSEIPPIEVALIDRPTMALNGAGEASMPPVGGALANAIFDATGVRLRTVPFTPERVKAALQAAKKA